MVKEREVPLLDNKQLLSLIRANQILGDALGKDLLLVERRLAKLEEKTSKKTSKKKE